MYHIKDDEKFALDFLKEEHVLWVHGGGFNWKEPNHFRIVYLPRIEELKIALKEIEIAINSLDGCEKAVCHYRFILGASWLEMPKHIGYEQSHCTRFEKLGVEKICRKYMKNRLVS
jgi:hypothetical protein